MAAPALEPSVWFSGADGYVPPKKSTGTEGGSSVVSVNGTNYATFGGNLAEPCTLQSCMHCRMGCDPERPEPHQWRDVTHQLNADGTLPEVPAPPLIPHCSFKQVVEFAATVSMDDFRADLAKMEEHHDNTGTLVVDKVIDAKELKQFVGGGVQNFHVVPVNFEVMRSANGFFPVPLSVQLTSRIPSNEYNVAFQSWLAANVCVPHGGAPVGCLIEPSAASDTRWETRGGSGELHRYLLSFASTDFDKLRAKLAEGRIPLYSAAEGSKEYAVRSVLEWLRVVALPEFTDPAGVLTPEHITRIEALIREIETHADKHRRCMSLDRVALQFMPAHSEANKQLKRYIKTHVPELCTDAERAMMITAASKMLKRDLTQLPEETVVPLASVRVRMTYYMIPNAHTAVSGL